MTLRAIDRRSRKEIQEFYDCLDIDTRAKMEILKALFFGMVLTLLTLALAIGFVVSLVFAIGRLGTAVERAIKQRSGRTKRSAST